MQLSWMSASCLYLGAKAKQAHAGGSGAGGSEPQAVIHLRLHFFEEL
jgi:hypothetical protein